MSNRINKRTRPEARPLFQTGAWSLFALCVAALAGACDTQLTGPEDVQDVGAVVVEGAAHELDVGQTLQVSATVLDTMGAVLPGRAVEWSSSDESVATVSTGGLVTAVSAGEAVITAVSQGVTGTFDIRVFPPECSPSLAGEAAVGNTYSGVVTENDCYFLEDLHAVGYRINAAAGTRVLVTLASDAAEGVVVVTGADMAVTNFTFNSLLVQMDAGEQLLWVTWVSQETAMSYTLVLEEVESRSCDEPVGSVGLGTTVQGTLSALSCMNFGSYFADPWTFTLAEAGSLVIDLQSPDFDTYLLLQDATGQYVAEDDDGGTNLNSRIAGSFQAGTYTIWVTSFSAGETGSYTLSVSRNAPQALESSTLQNLAGLRASDFNLRPLTDVVPTKPHSPRGG